MERSYASQLAAVHVPPFGSDCLMGMNTSADGSDDDVLFGSVPAELSDLLAWDVLGGGHGSTTTQQVPSPPQSAIFRAQQQTPSIGGGSSSGGDSGSSGGQSPVANIAQQCNGGLGKPCIVAAASTVSALHTSAEMCLSSSPSPTTTSLSSSASTLSTLSPSATTAVTTITTSTDALHAQHPGRTVDAVLTATHEASRAISKSLGCSTCSSQPQLHLLIATALEKLVGWYRAVIAGMRARTTTASTTTASMMTTTGAGEEEDFLPTVLVQSLGPLAIGSHLVEDSLHAAIVAQVLTHRLRELKSTVELLARSMGEASKSDSARGGISGNQSYGRGGDGRHAVVKHYDTRLPEAVREKLVARVRQRLLAAWEELSMLREGQRGTGESLWLY